MKSETKELTGGFPFKTILRFAVLLGLIGMFLLSIRAVLPCSHPMFTIAPGIPAGEVRIGNDVSVRLRCVYSSKNNLQKTKDVAAAHGVFLEQVPNPASWTKRPVAVFTTPTQDITSKQMIELATQCPDGIEVALNAPGYYMYIEFRNGKVFKAFGGDDEGIVDCVPGESPVWR